MNNCPPNCALCKEEQLQEIPVEELTEDTVEEETMDE